MVFSISLNLLPLEPYNRSFIEVLKDPEHLEFFRYYLQQQGGSAEMLVVFWLAVEGVKKSLGNKKTRQLKMRRIQQKFFNSGMLENCEFQIHFGELASWLL